MEITRTLPAPRLPSADDGVIDKSDYNSNQVFAFIYYKNMRPSDTINIFWDNNEVGSINLNEKVPKILTFQINQSLMTNGTHVIDYNVTDKAGNQGVSEYLTVYVQKDSYAKKIPAPQIIGADSDNNISKETIENYNGALVYIKKSDEISKYVGHLINIVWLGFDHDGYPIVTGNAEHEKILTREDSEGIFWRVPLETVKHEFDGGAKVYYFINVGTERIFSELTTITIGDGRALNQKITLSADPSHIIADGLSGSVLTATVSDKKGNVLSGVIVEWDARDAVLTNISGTTDNNGQVQNYLTSTHSGNITVTAKLQRNNNIKSSVNVLSIPDHEVYKITDITSNKININADGLDRAIISCKVADSKNNPTADQIVKWFANSGDLSSSSSKTNSAGIATTELSAEIAGIIRVTASLKGAEAKTIEITASQQGFKIFKIMGQRQVYGGYGKSRQPRLIAIDSVTLKTVIVDWLYEGSQLSVTSSSFIDTQPHLAILVSAKGFVSLKVNPSNISGNGSYFDGEISPGAFSSLTDKGHIYSWGFRDYGGYSPSQESIYRGFYQNAHSFAAVSKLDNSLLFWGKKDEGGEPPSKIAVRRDTNMLSGGFTTMGMIGIKYPYVQVWGLNSEFYLKPPAYIVSKKNLSKIFSSTNAYAVVDDNGHVYAWGAGDSGGNVPASISGLNNIYDVASTDTSFAALFGDGQVTAWGNELNGGNACKLLYRTGIQRIFSTNAAFAALFRAGNVLCWGNKEYGAALPSAVEELTDIVDICSTYGAFAALRRNGQVVSWGNKKFGSDNSAVASRLHDVVAISSTGAAFCALRADGSVVTWGSVRDGGDTSPVSSELHDILAVYGNTRAFAALRFDRQLVCWGEGVSGAEGIPDGLQGNISYATDCEG